MTNTTGLEEPQTIASDCVQLAAPVHRVWTVLTDFAAYGEWNPLCHSISVDPVVGGAVAMQVQDESLGRLATLDYVLSALERDRLLAWTGFFPNLGLVARRDQYVQALDGERTLYWTIDVYGGSGASELAAQNGAWVRDSFNRMADALRRRVETQP